MLDSSYQDTVRYAIHNGKGKYLRSFVWSKDLFRGQFVWVDRLEKACYFSRPEALALVTFFSLCGFYYFGILRAIPH